MMYELVLSLLFVAMVIGPVFIKMRAHSSKEIDPRVPSPRS